MTIRSKEALQARQEEMRQRVIQEKLAKQKLILPPVDPRIPLSPFSIVSREKCSTGCGRYARKGSTLCSRCSFKQQEADLRDTLPGLNPPTGSAEAATAAHEILAENHGLDPGVLYARVIPAHVRVIPAHESEKRPYKAYLDGEQIPSSSIKQYTRKQVSREIGVAVNTISRWEKKGKTPAPLKIAHSGQYVYTQEHLDWLKAYVSRMEQVIHPIADPTVKAAKEVQGKTFKPNKRLERAVSSRISLGGGRSIL